MTLPELIAELEKHDAAMTPGEWQRRDTIIGQDKYHASTEIVGRVQNGGSTPVCKLAAGFVWFEGDCAGIAALRNALPDILRELRRLAAIDATSVERGKCRQQHIKLTAKPAPALGERPRRNQQGVSDG